MDVPEDLANDAATALSAVDQAPIMLLGLEGEELRWVLTNGSLLIVPPGRVGARPIADRLACVRVLVRRCGRPRAVTARSRSLELSTFPGVENVALAPS